MARWMPPRKPAALLPPGATPEPGTRRRPAGFQRPEPKPTQKPAMQVLPPDVDPLIPMIFETFPGCEIVHLYKRGC